jgi:hypothetical protein
MHVLVTKSNNYLSSHLSGLHTVLSVAKHSLQFVASHANDSHTSPVLVYNNLCSYGHFKQLSELKLYSTQFVVGSDSLVADVPKSHVYVDSLNHYPNSHLKHQSSCI